MTFTEKAYLQYSQINPNLVDLEHTVVPERHRGHGIGHVLAKVIGIIQNPTLLNSIRKVHYLHILK